MNEAFGAGRRASQIVHFSLAESGFLSIHVSQVHSVPLEDAAELDDPNIPLPLEGNEKRPPLLVVGPGVVLAG